MSALAKLRAERGRMSLMDRRIADFIEANAPLLRDYSSQQLADALGLSQSSIVKFAQRMGFKGYPDLKLSVNEAVARAAAVLDVAGRAEAAVDEASARAEALWLAKAAAEKQTRELNDSDTIARVATWLAKADTLFLAGTGLDGDAVHTFGKRLALLGQRCITSQQGGELLGAISAATRRDVMLVVCSDEQGRRWLPCCRSLRAAGGRVITIARRRQTGLTPAADAAVVIAAHDPLPHIDDLVYDAALRHLLDDLFMRVVAGRADAALTYRQNREQLRGIEAD